VPVGKWKFGRKKVNRKSRPVKVIVRPGNFISITRSSWPSTCSRFTPSMRL
jgi:hypothetical protein